MLKEPSGLRGDLPVAGIGPRAPLVDLPANFIDARSEVVSLLFGGEPQPFVEIQRLLVGVVSSTPFRLRNRSDELRAPARFDDLLRRLPIGIELPMAAGKLVGGIEDWMVEERVRHCSDRLTSKWDLNPRRPI